MERLASLDAAADPELETQTIALLERHEAEIRNLQIKNNFVVPGVPELSEALRGRRCLITALKCKFIEGI